MAEEPTAPAGMNRRDVLKRGAFVGGAGAIAWAAPTIATFGPRAFAQTGTEEPGGPGAVSWIMVWFQCGTEYHLVKYEGTSSGYSQKCDADRGNVSRDGAEGVTYFDQQQAKVDALNLTRSTACPPDVAVTARDGVLRLTVAGDCTIVGWVLHDGSCGAGNTYPKFRSVENSLKNPSDPSEGHVGPVGSALEEGGPFEWYKCK